MSDQQVRLGDLLKIDGFDPMNVDVGYVQRISHMVPRDGSIDLHEAEKLATMFLACADYCGELISQAVRLVGFRDADRKSQKGDAIEKKIAGKTPATTARETYSNDPDYVVAAKAHADAEAFLVWIKQKYENLIKAHVLCKDLLKAHVENRNVSGWDGVEEDFSSSTKDTSAEKQSDRSGISGINNITEDDFIDLT